MTTLDTANTEITRPSPADDAVEDHGTKLPVSRIVRLCRRMQLSAIGPFKRQGNRNRYDSVNNEDKHDRKERHT